MTWIRTLRNLLSLGMVSAMLSCGSDNSTDNRDDPSESDPLYGHRFGDDAFRCDEASAQLTAGEPTYSADIGPLLQTACVSCHVKDGTNPDLSTFDFLKLGSGAALDQMNQGLMPPSGGLPADQLALFKSWIDGGMLPGPEGPAAKPTARCGTVPASK